MADPKIDALLAEFLADQQEAKRHGVTLETIAEAQKTLADGLNAHAKRDEELHEKFDTRLASHAERLTSVEAKLHGVEREFDREIITGRHDIPAILRAAQHKSISPLGRVFEGELAKNLIKAAFLLLAGGIGYIVHILSGSAH